MKELFREKKHKVKEEKRRSCEAEKRAVIASKTISSQNSKTEVGDILLLSIRLVKVHQILSCCLQPSFC